MFILCIAFSFLPVFAMAAPSGATTASLTFEHSNVLTNLGDWLDLVRSESADSAMLFSCRKIFPPLRLSESQIAEIARSASNSDAANYAANASAKNYFVSASLGSSMIFAISRKPITEIPHTWPEPTRIVGRSNQIIFTAVLKKTDHHGVEARVEPSHAAHEFGVVANRGFSVVHLIHFLDIANLGGRWLDSGGADRDLLSTNFASLRQSLTMVKDPQNMVTSISVTNGIECSLQQRNQGNAAFLQPDETFLYEIKSKGVLIYQLALGDVRPLIGNKNSVFHRLWSQLVPDENGTMIAYFKDNATVPIYYKRSEFNPIEVSKSIPFKPLISNTKTKSTPSRLLRILLISGFIIIIPIMMHLNKRSITNQHKPT